MGILQMEKDKHKPEYTLLKQNHSLWHNIAALAVQIWETISAGSSSFKMDISI